MIKRKKIVLFVMLLFGAALLTALIYYPNLKEGNSEEYHTPTTGINDPSHPDYDTIENGVHLRTGFVEGEGLQLVINNCTSCHSAKLVTQNRMSKERWQATIRWMQETQNLWDLGANEEAIVAYLAANYAPIAKGRRQNLNTITWYELEEQ